MAKFFITNSQKYYNSLKGQIAHTNFSLSFDYANNGVYALATHKLGMHNRNAVQVNEDFCVATGTCIYKESLDYLPLLNDFDGDMSQIRENTIGQYAICVKKDNRLSVWGDACGCYDIYYYNENGTWLISNSLYDIAEVIGHKLLPLNEFNVIVRMANRYIPNAQTFFDHISYIRGEEYINVDLQSSQFNIVKNKVDFPVGDDSFENLVTKAAEALKNNARIAAKVLGTPTICVTGGLDSRLVLASFLANGIKPHLFYGVGNNRITSPRKEDELCVEQLSKEFNLPIQKGDFFVSSPLDADWNNYINDCGFTTAYMWGGQKNVIDSLRSGTDLLMFGWGGELYRNISGWTEQKAEESITLHELLSKWYIARAQSAPLIREAIPDYDARVEQEMRKECEHLGLNPERMSIDDSFFIEMKYRTMADTQIPSFIQYYKYAYLPLFEHNVLINRVHSNEKDFVKFMLALCSAIYHDILRVAFFTHQQWKTFDADSMSLRPAKSNYDRLSDSFFAKVLRVIAPKSIKQYIFRPLKRKLKANQKQPKLAPDCVINEFDTLNNAQYHINMSDIRRSEDTVMWAILLRALKKLGY
ncbi:MAG: hypothetical protein IJS13_09085 [Paludibacteraceae bacterium]|nr:hypothetical protein [Paludibacteraceae bacterium]